VTQVTQNALGAWLLLAPAALSAQAPARPISLPWRQFDVELQGPARPGGYLSVIGRRAAH